MATNPNPRRISSAMWRLWEEFRDSEPSALLGGIYANKAGYHNYRGALSGSDYSLRDLAADRAGPLEFASAIDLTMSDAAMRRYTQRLKVAATRRDPRLYHPTRGVVLREFIGTLDSSNVYCYVLTGGRPLGVGFDAGEDEGRDDSHLWHLHLSIIRAFCTDWPILDGVLSVLRGETLNAYQERTTHVGLNTNQDNALAEVWAAVVALRDGTPVRAAGNHPGGPLWTIAMINQLNAKLAALPGVIAQSDTDMAARIRAEFVGLESALAVDLHQVQMAAETAHQATLSAVDQVDENVIQALGDGTVSVADAAAALLAAWGPERTRQMITALSDATAQ